MNDQVPRFLPMLWAYVKQTLETTRFAATFFTVVVVFAVVATLNSARSVPVWVGFAMPFALISFSLLACMIGDIIREVIERRADR